MERQRREAAEQRAKEEAERIEKVSALTTSRSRILSVLTFFEVAGSMCHFPVL